jgi:hypothetical protein
MMTEGYSTITEGYSTIIESYSTALKGCFMTRKTPLSEEHFYIINVKNNDTIRMK